MVLSLPTPVSSNTLYILISYATIMKSAPCHVFSWESQCLHISGRLKAGTPFLHEYKHWRQNGLKHGRVKSQWHDTHTRAMCHKVTFPARLEKRSKIGEKMKTNVEIIRSNDNIRVWVCVRGRLCPFNCQQGSWHWRSQVGWIIQSDTNNEWPNARSLHKVENEDVA